MTTLLDVLSTGEVDIPAGPLVVGADPGSSNNLRVSGGEYLAGGFFSTSQTIQLGYGNSTVSNDVNIIFGNYPTSGQWQQLYWNHALVAFEFTETVYIGTSGDAFGLGVGIAGGSHSVETSGDIRMQGGRNNALRWNNGSCEAALTQVGGASPGIALGVADLYVGSGAAGATSHLTATGTIYTSESYQIARRDTGATVFQIYSESGAFEIYDNANSRDTVTFKAGGEVDVSYGPLFVGGTPARSRPISATGSGETGIAIYNDEATYAHQYELVVGGSGTYGVNTYRGWWFLFDQTNNRAVVAVDTANNVRLGGNDAMAGTPALIAQENGTVIVGSASGATLPSTTFLGAEVLGSVPATNAPYTALSAFIYADVANISPNGSTFGITGHAQQDHSSGVAANVSGVVASATLTNSGEVTTLKGLTATCGVTGSGRADNVACISIDGPTIAVGSGGAITNEYGIDVDDLSTGTNRTGVYIGGVLITSTSTTPSGYYGLYVDSVDTGYAIQTQNGTVAFNDGVVCNAGVYPANMGPGTINVATGLYFNGTAYNNPDYVFELAYEGRVISPAPKGFDGLWGLPKVEAHTREHYSLPGRECAKDLFARAQWLEEKLEEAYLFLFDHDRRLRALESSRV